MDINSENLIEMLPQLGEWSIYYLAEKALVHYFPELKEGDGYVSTVKAASCLSDMGFAYWEEVVEKYHKEVGYSNDLLSNKEIVNEH